MFSSSITCLSLTQGLLPGWIGTHWWGDSNKRSLCETLWPSVPEWFLRNGLPYKWLFKTKWDTSEVNILGVIDPWTSDSLTLGPRWASNTVISLTRFKFLVKCHSYALLKSKWASLIVCPMPTSEKCGGKFRRPWGSPKTEDQRWVRPTEEVQQPGTR